MKTNNKRSLLIPGLLLLPVLLLSGSAFAQQSETASDKSGAKEAPSARAYSQHGADTCLKCHDEESTFPVYSIFKTKHAVRSDKRTPFAKLQCETCHGPIGEHGKMILHKGEKRAPMITFGAKSAVPVTQQNVVCLDCHAGGRINWKGSSHEAVDVACTSCHKIHAPRDPVLVKYEQPEVCYQCHKQQRADFYKPSVHPVRFGVMTCSQCHNTHGAVTASLLARPTLNQTCYGCHPEKRGPFLWEHAPVSENCALCHVPHGSIQPALLIKRPPWLCQQCHAQASHPSVNLTPTNLPNGAVNQGFLVSGACTNCHSQVHGSNHPSGVKLMR
jgi:DmsE family decaheme c-type cytochrome